jgi:hypothetical protein
MDTVCPLCRSAIAIADINVATDIALCRRCGKTFSLSELLNSSSSATFDVASPPNGAWFKNTGDGVTIGATTRSWMALFLFPFTCAWSGAAVGGIYGRQISSGRFDPASSLFGLPFLLGSVFLIAYCAMMIRGKVEISQRGDSLAIFTRVGRLGWTRRYSSSDFRSAREDSRRNAWNWSNQGVLIVLEGKRRVAFGSMLNEERRYFVLSAFRKLLQKSARSGDSASAFARFR